MTRLCTRRQILFKESVAGHDQTTDQVEVLLDVAGHIEFAARSQRALDFPDELTGEDPALFVPRLPPRIWKVNVHRTETLGWDKSRKNDSCIPAPHLRVCQLV